MDVVANDVLQRARSIDRYVVKMESLRRVTSITQLDLNRVYAMATMEFVTYLERSLERLFTGIVMGRYVGAGCRPLVSIQSEVVARATFRGERRYVDWLPYRITRKRAAAFLSGGRPFDRVSSRDEKFLDHLLVVRNAIAHDSGHAHRRFRAEFTIGLALPPAQQRLAGYLQGQHAVGQSRLQYLIAEGSRVVGDLCA